MVLYVPRDSEHSRRPERYKSGSFRSQYGRPKDHFFPSHSRSSDSSGSDSGNQETDSGRKPLMVPYGRRWGQAYMRPGTAYEFVHERDYRRV